LKEIKKGKQKEEFEAEEDIAEFKTRNEGEKDNQRTAILDYVYTRGKEIVGTNHKENIKGVAKYTGKTKVGYCVKHGQVDADLNASRTIALCKYFEINDPKIWK